MQTDTVSIDQFITANGITMSCERTDSNPNMPDSRDMDHWKCTLIRRVTASGKWYGQRMTVRFSMGYGHHGAERC